jgi:hypothetical protein
MEGVGMPLSLPQVGLLLAVGCWAVRILCWKPSAAHLRVAVRSPFRIVAHLPTLPYLCPIFYLQLLRQRSSMDTLINKEAKILNAVCIRAVCDVAAKCDSCAVFRPLCCCRAVLPVASVMRAPKPTFGLILAQRVLIHPALLLVLLLRTLDRARAEKGQRRGQESGAGRGQGAARRAAG